MNRKRGIISFGIILLLVITSFPTFNSQSTDIIVKNSTNYQIKSKDNVKNSEIIDINVIQSWKKGDVKITTKKMTSYDKNEMMKKLMQINTSNLNPKEIFKEKLEILKEYKLVSDELSLDEIIDVDKFENKTSLNKIENTNENFMANYSPIFIAGVGFGGSLGFRRMPTYQRLTGNIFSVGLIVVGVVFCYDWFKPKPIYHPVLLEPLVYFLAGFIGIMLFAYDDLFTSTHGVPPVTFYSNLIAIGIAGSIIGIKFNIG